MESAALRGNYFRPNPPASPRTPIAGREFCARQPVSSVGTLPSAPLSPRSVGVGGGCVIGQRQWWQKQLPFGWGFWKVSLRTTQV